MTWSDYYAIAASAVSLVVIGWGIGALRRPGPRRGMGGAQAAILIVAVMAVAALHGIIVTGIALAMSRNAVSWSAVAVHGLILVGTVIRIKTT